MATLIKLQKAFAPYSIEFPFPDDTPFTLIEYPHHALILLKLELPTTFPWKEPTILLSSLGGVKTVGDVRAHFQFEHDLDVDQLPPKDDPYYKQLKKEGDVLTTELCPLGTVVTINLGHGGYIPGNTYIYLLLKHPLSCIYVGPTYYLTIDWSQLKVND
jgi:hypothetical protein